MINDAAKKKYWMPLWGSHTQLEMTQVEQKIVNRIRLLLCTKEEDNVVEAVLNEAGLKVLRVKNFKGVEHEIDCYVYHFFPVVIFDNDQIYNKHINNKDNDNFVIINSYNVTIFNETALIKKMRSLFDDNKVITASKKKLLLKRGSR